MAMLPLPLLLLLLALALGRVAGACERATSALSTACGGLCLEGRPCVALAADATCDASNSTFASCAEDESSGCAFECFTNGPDDFAANGIVDFSDYVFFVTVDGASAAENESDEHPSAPNAVVATAEALTLLNTTTKLTIAGGLSVDGERDVVANLTLADGFLGSDPNLLSITLANLYLGDTALPTSTFPPQLTALTLRNCMLTSYPLDLPLLVELENLDLSQNELVDFSGKLGEPTLLRTLNLSGNSIVSFKPSGNFTNVTSLDLSNNSLSTIPAAVFEFTALETLNLTGNRLKSVQLSPYQEAFLKALTNFSIDTFGGVDGCEESQQATIAGVSVCLTSDASSSGSSGATTAGTSSSSSSNIGAIAGGVVGGLVAIAIIAGLFLLRRKRNRKEALSLHMPDDRDIIQHDSKTTAATTGGTSNDSNHLGTQHQSLSSQSMSQSRDTGSLWTDQELLSLQVNLDDVQDVRKIGAGAFCVVYLATFRRTQYVASKRLKRDEVSWRNTQRFLEEIKLVSKLDHPRVVKLVGVAWSIEADLQALFEYMENGDLRTHLERTAPYDRRWWTDDVETDETRGNKLQMAIDIAEALVYVHSFAPPLVHRDLKSRNVLLDSQMRAHVSDFGVARYSSVDATMTAGVGTGRWLAPEVIAGSGDYDQSCDIYSFGVVLAEMDTHTLPYDDARGSSGHKLADVAVLQLVAAGRLLPSFTRECPPRVRELALRCMSFNPRDRPSAVEVAYALRSLQKSVRLSSGVGFVV